MSNPKKNLSDNSKTSYNELTVGIVNLLETARRQAARSINVILTATYWEIGRRIVEFEQLGSQKAEYGKKILKQLSAELTAKFGRGFGWRNLYQMRNFYLSYRNILQTASAKFKKIAELEKLQTLSAKFHEPTISRLQALSACFLLSWSHYVRLLSVENENARSFYEAEAGKIHLYLNYAREHWTHEKENPLVGLILCAEKNHAVAKYALDGLPNKVLASEYKLSLPKEEELAEELTKTIKMLETRQRRQKENASK